MSSPWHILGLDPDTATEKDVKVAYAKLIKIHRPDSDPEGFQRVRQAYEGALALLKSGQRHNFVADGDDKEFAPPSTFVEESRPPLLPQESLPPDLIEIDLAVARARENNEEAALKRIIASLQAVCLKLRPGQAGWQLWRTTLHRITEGRSKLVADSLPVSQLINEMESGSAGITHAVVGYWEDSWDTDRLVVLTDAILADKARLQNMEAGVVALRLGIDIGFVKPVIASMLITFAFPHVDREARENLIPRVEEQASIGKLMIGLSRDQQQFWHRRILQRRSEWDWNSVQADEALKYLVNEKGPHWGGYGIVKQIVPEEWFTKLEREMGRVRGGIAGRMKRPSLGNPRPLAPQNNGKSLWRFSWIVFLVISTLARIVPLIESSQPPRAPELRKRYETYKPLEPTGQSSPLVIPPLNSQAKSTVILPPGVNSRVEKSMADFKTQIGSDGAFAGVPATRSSNSSSLTMPRGTSLPKPKLTNDFGRNLKPVDKPLQVWMDRASDIDRLAVEKGKNASKAEREEIDRQCRRDLAKLIKGLRVATGDFNAEKRFADALVTDARATANQRYAGMENMIENDPPEYFLPKWQLAAGLNSLVAEQVAEVAAGYLDHPKRVLMEEERQGLMKLAAKKR